MNRPRDRRQNSTHPHNMMLEQRFQRRLTRVMDAMMDRRRTATAGIDRDRYDAIERRLAGRQGLSLAAYRASADYIPY